jgi:short-subunit dehydrogenase
MIFQGDVCDYSTNADLIQKIIERFGQLDAVITSAALSCFGEVEKMEVTVAKKIIDTNIYGSFYPVKVALEELKQNKGSILFVSSIAAFHGLPGYSAYSLSKMALKALAQCLSVELKKSDVFVGIAYVGFTENEDGKQTLSPAGEWQKVPPRKAVFTVSRKTTALKLLKQIKKRRFSHTHSRLGSFTEWITRFFPKLSLFLFQKNYRPAKKDA